MGGGRVIKGVVIRALRCLLLMNPQNVFGDGGDIHILKGESSSFKSEKISIHTDLFTASYHRSLQLFFFI